MRSKSILSVSILLVVLLVSSDASAGRYWFYSPVEGPDDMPLGGGNSAIGMRSGNTWPVVAYSEGQYGDGGAAAMMPGYWLQGPVGFYGPVVINGATAPDGTVGFADNHGGVVTFGQNGWGSGSYNGDACYRASMSFNNNSEPGVLHNNYSGDLTLSMRSGATWYQSVLENGYEGPFHSDGYALDFDSYNQANVVFAENSHLVFGSKGVMSGGQWAFSNSENSPFISGDAVIDMSLTGNDIPYVVYAEYDSLKYAIYDRQTNNWSAGVIDSLFSGSANFVVESDGDGGIGVAYVTEFLGNSVLSFAYTDGSSGFGLERLTEANWDCTVGLAFDFEGNPVISYDNNSELWIAYDPVVPEPATVAMLLIGGCLAFRRKR